MIFEQKLEQLNQSALRAMGIIMILHMVANIFLEQITLLLFLPCNKAQSLNTYNQFEYLYNNVCYIKGEHWI